MIGSNSLGFLALVCLATLTFSSASTMSDCDCETPATAQEGFCRAVYSVLLKVKDETTEGDAIKYGIQMLGVNKLLPGAMAPPISDFVQTPSQQSEDSKCAVKLEVGKLYMIGANNDELTVCDYVADYSTMTEDDRNIFGIADLSACT